MYHWTTTSATFAFACATILYIGRRVLGGRSPYPLPPGPPGLPWVGNIIGINVSAPWITYGEWARTYGDIVYSRLLGKDIIILNSEKIAKDLLEHRSGNYSDRLYFTTPEMYGLGFNSALLPYGNRWRLHRRFFHQTFRLDAVSRFLPLQHRKACDFLRWLLNSPEQQLDDHVFEYTASIILNSTYDYDPASRKDELVDIAADVLKIMVPAIRPEVATIVDFFPLLLHLPSWFPGMSFKKQMAIARTFSEQYLKRPFEYSIQRAGGSVAPSMVHDALRGMEEKEISPSESWMETLKEASGTAFLAAAETSHSVLMMIFLTMVVNPAVQEKAQAQIDAVVGRARLPTIDDRPLLPFIDAIIWETLRCNPIAPLSFPHAAVDEDVYRGFHIPKGAVVVTNVWAMAHDESRYPNSHTFTPERFLDEDGFLKPNDIEHITYGFGRRMCVGRHFADTSVWSVIAKVLAVFKILKPVDENGVEIPVEPRFSSGIVVHPLPFGYRIVPRFPGMDTEKLEQLIAASTA